MRRVLVAAMVLVFAGCSDSTTGASTTFTAALSAAKEVPVVASSATGSASCTAASPNVSCTVTYTALSGAPTAAHIHTGNANATGPVRVNLCGAGTAPACPATVAGTITSGAQPVTGVTWQALVDAMHTYGAYVNIHTATNGGGEARGQLFGSF